MKNSSIGPENFRNYFLKLLDMSTKFLNFKVSKHDISINQTLQFLLHEFLHFCVINLKIS